VRRVIAVSVIFSVFIVFAASLFAAAPPQKKLSRDELRKKGLLCSFEVLPSETAIGDFDWNTNGYVAISQFRRYATNGKHSCQAVFSVPSDFMPAAQAAKVKSWEAGMTMSIDTLTRLKVTDWSMFRRFGVDVYSADEEERVFYIKFNDVNGREYIASKPVKNGRNRLEVMLKEVKAQRINTSNIISLTLYMDTKDYPSNVTLYIDNVRLIP